MNPELAAQIEAVLRSRSAAGEEGFQDREPCPLCGERFSHVCYQVHPSGEVIREFPTEGKEAP